MSSNANIQFMHIVQVHMHTEHRMQYVTQRQKGEIAINKINSPTIIINNIINEFI